MFQVLTTYHVVRPHHSLCLELGAIAYLQCPRASAGEEVGDLFPCQVLRLLQLNKQCIILWCELELRSFGFRGIVVSINFNIHFHGVVEAEPPASATCQITLLNKEVHI